MTLVFAQVFHLGNARGGSVLHWRRATANLWALAAVALTVALQLLAIYVAPLAGVLRVVPLTTRDWMLILPLSLLPAVVGQAIAWVRVRGGRGDPQREPS
jgi:Ca2+-transporting ATPase